MTRYCYHMTHPANYKVLANGLANRSTYLANGARTKIADPSRQEPGVFDELFAYEPCWGAS